MKDYLNYTAVELAQEEDFIRWVEAGHNDPELNNQWQAWFLMHPEKIEVVNEAKRIIKAIDNERQYFLHDSKQQELWSRIEYSIEKNRKNHLKTRSTWFAIAASVLLLSALFFLLQNNELSTPQKYLIKQVAEGNVQLLDYRNDSDKPYALTLEDGSVVTLQPHSEIRYPKAFAETHRDVYLAGEAFFDVMRNTKKPFSVYTSEIVTRVLGTSFTVRAYEKDPEVTVAVKTGKVSVLTEAESRMKIDSSQHLVGTLLTPNQQIVFSIEKARMVKSLVEQPEYLPSAAEKESFEFVDTPIQEVFGRLEKAYAIQIIFDEEIMSNCFLNTSSLRDISFYDKLRLICKSVNAKYEVIDAHVLITGNGCK